MGPLTITDSEGKAVSLTGIDVESLVKLVRKSQARKTKLNYYVNLAEISATEGDKGIRFSFANGSHFEYSIITKKFTHGSDGSEFLDTHFKHIVISNYGQNGFWAYLKTFTKDIWVRKFFDLVAQHIDRGSSRNTRELAAKNKFQYFLEGIDSYINIFEGIAKAAILQKFEASILLKMSREVAGSQTLYGDAKTIIKNNFNSWFVEHQDEMCDPSWWGRNQAQTPLKNELTKYNHATSQKLDHVFEYCWEKYRKPVTFDSYGIKDRFIRMIGELKYDYKRLMDYLMVDLSAQGKLSNREGWADGRILNDLYDYANMNNAMGVKYDKYPKYLATLHDITTVNYNFWQRKSEADAKIDKEKLQTLAFEDKEYKVVIPNNAADIIMEGSNLNHCVASYVSDVIAGKTNIVFIRTTIAPEESLLTVQVSNDKTILQVRGHSNRNPYESEQKFIEKYKEHLKALVQKEIFEEKNKAEQAA